MYFHAALQAGDFSVRKNTKGYPPIHDSCFSATSTSMENLPTIHLPETAYVMEPRPTYQPERYRERTYGEDMLSPFPGCTNCWDFVL